MRYPALALASLLLLALEAVPAADKPDKWLEVRSPHFVVMSNAGERAARSAANQFEQFREVFRVAMPGARVDSGVPLVILAVKDEKSLKSLLPQFYEKKGALRVAGYFLRSPVKAYVVLRLDAPGENPYRVLYHEYVHNLEHLNYEVVPLWAAEGLAEFFGHAEIREKEVIIGRPAENQTALLRSTPLLPLETLFAVDYSSPYYNESNNVTIFYAESWALVHYLMMSEQGDNRSLLSYYLQLLGNDVPQPEAAVRAFGDLPALFKKLQDYIRHDDYLTFKVPPGAVPNERSFTVRAVPDAESLAIRGDFHLQNGRIEEAQELLEQALRLDANLTLAHEGMGFLNFKKGNREEAEKWYASAVKLDSENYFAHYYHALAMARIGEDVGDFEATEKHLRRAIELNPDFAPAYATLATALLEQGSRLDAALRLAMRAAEIEPGRQDHQLVMGNVLLRLGRVDEAVRVGQRMVLAARNEAERNSAAQFVSDVQNYQTFLAEKKRREEAEAAEQKALEERRLKRSQGRKTSAAIGKGRSAAVVPAGPNNAAARGKITGVICSDPALLDLLLDTGSSILKLHSENYFKVEFYTVNWQPPADFQPCEHLNGLHVKVDYHVVQGKPYAGDIVTIEVRK